MIWFKLDLNSATQEEIQPMTRFISGTAQMPTYPINSISSRQTGVKVIFYYVNEVYTVKMTRKISTAKGQ